MPPFPIRGEPRNAVLIGPMGSGKSTVGAALARRLGRPHVDTDQFFVARHGPIPEYFAAHGEAGFRKLEETIVAELLDSPRPSVVSLGGGSVLSERVRTMLTGQFVVMLDVSEDQARARIGDAATRPVLRKDQAEDPIVVWKRLYLQREPLYRQCADLVVSAREETVESRVDTIVATMSTQRRCPPRPES